MAAILSHRQCVKCSEACEGSSGFLNNAIQSAEIAQNNDWPKKFEKKYIPWNIINNVDMQCLKSHLDYFIDFCVFYISLKCWILNCSFSDTQWLTDQNNLFCLVSYKDPAWLSLTNERKFVD